MSNNNIKKFLDIDSTYRDRNRFPNPGQFDIIIGNSLPVCNFVDPISEQTPIITFTPSINYFSLQNGTLLLSPPPFPYQIDEKDSIVVCFDNFQNVNKTYNYYRGIGLTFITSLPSIEIITISGWIYIGTINNKDCFRIKLNTNITTDLTDPTLTLSFDPQVNYSQGYIHIPSGVITSDEYKNYYIHNETIDEYVNIISYDGTIALATFNAPVFWVENQQISIRKKLPGFRGTFGTGSTNKQLVLSSSTPNIEKGSFIRLIGSSNNNEIRFISSYEPFVATISEMLPSSPNAGDTYEILDFYRDNYNPLLYTGKSFSSNVCYEVELISLTLPNIDLLSDTNPSNFPYLYVELQNIESSFSPNILYSNNTNSRKMLFKVPVTEVNPPEFNAFMSLNAGSTTETIKLNPNKSFRFGVYLPNGKPFESILKDTKSPLEPNRYLQISAIFSLNYKFKV